MKSYENEHLQKCKTLDLLSILVFVAQPRLFESHSAKLHHKHMHTLRARYHCCTLHNPLFLKSWCFKFSMCLVLNCPYKLHNRVTCTLYLEIRTVQSLYTSEWNLNVLASNLFIFCVKQIETLDLHSTAPCKTCLNKKYLAGLHLKKYRLVMKL